MMLGAGEAVLPGFNLSIFSKTGVNVTGTGSE